MGIAGGLFALSAAQAVSQISQGYAQKAEAKYNATLLEGKANLIGAQSEIENARYENLKAKYLSTSIANTAKAGIMPQGSAAAVMIEAQRQIGIDQAISDFNFKQEKNYTIGQAQAERRAGKQAVYSAVSNAFSTLLTGASNFAMAKYNSTSGKKDTTFDSVTTQRRGNTIYKSRTVV